MSVEEWRVKIPEDWVEYRVFQDKAAAHMQEIETKTGAVPGSSGNPLLTIAAPVGWEFKAATEPDLEGMPTNGEIELQKIMERLKNSFPR